MQKLLFLSVATLFLLFTSCEKDEHPHDEALDYHIHIQDLGPDEIKMGNDLHLEVEFENNAGEGVHNIQVSVMNKADGTILFSGPEADHVHTDNNVYVFTETLVISAQNQFVAETDYIIEAKVWDHDETEGVIRETLEFHVHEN